MLDYGNRNAVLQKYERLKEIYQLFLQRVDLYKWATGCEVTEFDSVIKNYEEFEGRLREWLEGGQVHQRTFSLPQTVEMDAATDLKEVRIETPMRKQEQLQPKASGSVIGGASVHSGISHRSSSSSSRLADARIKRELLKMRVQHLENEQKLLTEKILMDERLTVLKAKNQVEEADLECKMLENCVENTEPEHKTDIQSTTTGVDQDVVLSRGVSSHLNVPDKGITEYSNKHSEILHDGQRLPIGVQIMQPNVHNNGQGVFCDKRVQSGVSQDGTLGVQQNGQNVHVGVSGNGIGGSNDVRQAQSGPSVGLGMSSAYPAIPQGCMSGTSHVNNGMFTGSQVQGQTDMSQLVNAMLMNLNMPKQDIKCFSGDPAEYFTFMHNFDVNVANKMIDNNAKLTYLLQFCTGKASQSIENCMLLGPDGYEKAREILHMQYGNPHVVAHTMIHKVCSRNQIKENDSGGLWDLARELQRCLITLQKIGSHTSTDQLLKIQHVLPVRLQGEWAKKARSVMILGREPSLDDMVNFVYESAMVSSTVFGRSVGFNSASDMKKPKKKGTGRVASFATEVSTKSSAVKTHGGSTGFSNPPSRELSSQHKCECCGHGHLLLCVKTFQRCLQIKDSSSQRNTDCALTACSPYTFLVVA